MSHHEGPGCGCSSCLEMYPAPEPCGNCKRVERELAEARKELAQQYALRATYADSVETALRRAEQAESALTAARAEVERLTAKYGPPFGTWRGDCGHLWNREHGDARDAACPVCAEVERAARWFWEAGSAAMASEIWNDDRDTCFAAAWSRYVQRRGDGVGTGHQDVGL
jgi:hypothetical protein